MMRFFVTVMLAMMATNMMCAEDTPARVAPEDFVILAWRVAGDADTMRGIRECGFNLAGSLSPADLDAVAAAGLKAIVLAENTYVDDAKIDWDAHAIAEDAHVLIERTAQHAATYGFYLRDEPNSRMFPAIGRYVAAFQRAAPDTRPLVNLFPNYASPQQLGTETYEEYLERYITTVKPPLVSYDHYALREDGSLRGGYFANLEVVRSLSLAHHLSFWNIVLSNAHFDYAEPSAGGLRFQAFTTLAYGARGIGYFTYIAPDSGNYRLAPIDQFGHKTPTWDLLRNVNLQIHALAPTMIKLRSVGVFHAPDVPDGCHALADSKYVADLSGPGRFVVGEFEGPGGTPYVMVVNKDLRKSTHFGIRFHQAGRILQTNSYTGKTSEWAGENNWLAAGQGMLLSLQR